MTISTIRFSGWLPWGNTSTTTTEKPHSPTVRSTVPDSYSGDEKPKPNNVKAATPRPGTNEHKKLMQKTQPKRRGYPTKSIAGPFHVG